MDSERPRGVLVYPLTDDEVSGPMQSYALLVRADGQARMVHTEGVAYLVTEDKPWTWNDYNPAIPTFTVTELRARAEGVTPVDLADWVREHNARLEGNFALAYSWANQ